MRSLGPRLVFPARGWLQVEPGLEARTHGSHRLLLLPPDALRPGAPLPSLTGRPGSPAAEGPMTHRQHTGEASSTVGVRAQLPFFASPAMENGLASKVFWRAAFFSFDQPVTLRYPITAKAAVTGHVPKVLLSSLHARQNILHFVNAGTC